MFYTYTKTSRGHGRLTGETGIEFKTENRSMAEKKVGMPSVKGVGDSMVDFGLGLGGGIIYSLSKSVFGSGLVGGLLGAGLAGSIVKGERGRTIATILGFQSIVGGGSAAPAKSNGASAEVM